MVHSPRRHTAVDSPEETAYPASHDKVHMSPFLAAVHVPCYCVLGGVLVPQVLSARASTSHNSRWVQMDGATTHTYLPTALHVSNLREMRS